MFPQDRTKLVEEKPPTLQTRFSFRAKPTAPSSNARRVPSSQTFLSPRRRSIFLPRQGAVLRFANILIYIPLDALTYALANAILPSVTNERLGLLLIRNRRLFVPLTAGRWLRPHKAIALSRIIKRPDLSCPQTAFISLSRVIYRIYTYVRVWVCILRKILSIIIITAER